MSVPGYTLNLATAALTSTPKTMFMLIPGATVPANIVAFMFSPASAVACLIELVESTQATNGTAGTDSNASCKQVRGFAAGDTTAPVHGVRTLYTSEPTVLTVLYSWRVSSLLDRQWPLGREVQSLLSGSSKYKGLGFRITSASNVNCDMTIEFE